MFNKRPDGRVIRNLEPMQMIMPYVMKTRTDSMNMYEDTFACEPMDAYIKEKSAEGISLGYMRIIIAAVVRLIALRPQLNRFCMNGKIYARPKILVSFVVHPTLRDESVGTTIKLWRPFIKLVVNTLLWMDKHNIMPKAIIELSPFHTSFFITNLKSLGINHIYHHTYEFGTTGLFFAMGKEKPLNKKIEDME